MEVRTAPAAFSPDPPAKDGRGQIFPRRTSPNNLRGIGRKREGMALASAGGMYNGKKASAGIFSRDYCY